MNVPSAPVLVMTDVQRQESSSAWQAYNAMEATKQRHFEFLNVLERKKKNFNIDPTEEDRVLLERLLQDHDEQVKLFTLESKSLKEHSADAHQALFQYIGKINDLLVTDQNTH